ncbi:hypothetical protein BN134_2815 [Cronobacter dublinensis 1210]|uniref:Uncharacterized protein n=1 Tax=Cronobacter dublinensis 1210 TaxID=1208656 RepID=A0ABP1WBP9_9ENTR|nr:hypothetical protein BN134_2815 [Cronobacter dublinensis 1210]
MSLPCIGVHNNTGTLLLFFSSLSQHIVATERNKQHQNELNNKWAI